MGHLASLVATGAQQPTIATPFSVLPTASDDTDILHEEIAALHAMVNALMLRESLDKSPWE